MPLPEINKPVARTPIAEAVGNAVRRPVDVDIKQINDYLVELNDQNTAVEILDQLKTAREPLLETNREGMDVSQQAQLDFQIRKLNEDIAEIERYLGNEQPPNDAVICG